MHPFDAAIRLESLDATHLRGCMTQAYANMVGPFGGITCAILLEAALSRPERIGDPLSLTVNFAAPVGYDDFGIECRAVRTNRSTPPWTLAMSQAGPVVTTATLVTALRRETWSAREAVMPAGLPGADRLARAPHVELTPWVARYDLRFIDGGLDRFGGEEAPDSLSRLWVRDDPPRPLSFTSLASMSDCFFPRVMVRRRRMVPSGTVSVTTYFHADATLLARQGDRHVLGIARAAGFRNGFGDQFAELWSDAGDLLATTSQVCYFRD